MNDSSDAQRAYSRPLQVMWEYPKIKSFKELRRAITCLMNSDFDRSSDAYLSSKCLKSAQTVDEQVNALRIILTNGESRCYMMVLIRKYLERLYHADITDLPMSGLFTEYICANTTSMVTVSTIIRKRIFPPESSPLLQYYITLSCIQQDDVVDLFCYLRTPVFHSDHVEALRGKCLEWATSASVINPTLYRHLTINPNHTYTWTTLLSCASYAMTTRNIEVLWDINTVIESLPYEKMSRIRSVLCDAISEIGRS